MNYGDDKITKCEMCECEVQEEKVKHITIKGNVKKICKDCVTAIKGLV